MFHIFAVCPSSLVSDKIHSHFASTKGNFIADNILDKGQSSTTWNNKSLSDDDKRKFRDIKDYLKRKGAMFPYKTFKDINHLMSHLNSLNSKIENAITEEIQDPNCNKLINNEKFLFNNIDNLSKSVNDYKTAEILLNLIKPFCLQSYNFKLIDPYFYKGWINGKENKTKKKVEFLSMLCDHISKNHREVQHVTIDIYGQGYDNDGERGNSFANFLKNELSNLKEYYDLYEDGLLEDINFYGLERNNNKKLKIHDRLFLCDQFSLQLNDGFYSEPDLHNEYTLITDTKRIEKFENIYNKDSEEFYINFKFSLNDINFKKFET